MFEGLDIDDSALGLLRRLDRSLLEGIRVLLEQFIGHVGDFALGFGRLVCVLDTDGDDHLALPERNSVDDRGLDLLRHNGIRRLDHPDLGAGLHSDSPGELEIVQLLLEAVAHLGVVLCRLGILGKA